MSDKHDRTYLNDAEQVRLIELFVAEDAIQHEIGAIIGPVKDNYREARRRNPEHHRYALDGEWGSVYVAPLRSRALEAIKLIRHRSKALDV